MKDQLPPSSLSYTQSRQTLGETCWVWGGFGVSVFALYGHSLTGWWAFDDPQILKSAFLHAPWAYFFVPEVWKAFQPANLNPFILFSFDLDLALFGLGPEGFYAHQLIILWITAGMTFQLLRPWVTPFWAVAGPVLFIVSSPVTNTAYQLMTRHYLEGLLFSILAFHCYLQALRKFPLVWACLGGICYFCAASAKEVYVVLPLMLFLIPLGGWRKRVASLLPFFTVMGFYMLWRRYMLGTWVGGYGQTLNLTALHKGVVNIPSVIFGNSPLGIFAFSISVVVLLWSVWRNGSFRLWFLGWFFLILGPIIPVITISDPQRLLLFFVWVLSTAVVLCLGKCAFTGGRFKPVGMLLVVVMCVSFASRGLALRSDLEPACKGYEAQGRFIMEQNTEQVLLPFAPYGNWFTSGLVWLRGHILNEQPPRVIYDEIDLADLKAPVQNIFSFDPEAGRLRKIPGGVEGIRLNWFPKVSKEPVSVRMTYGEGGISWNFGPHVSGQYSIITYGENGSKMALLRSGFRRKEMTDPLVFRVRYDAPEGWIAYSDMFQFDGRALTAIEIPAKTGL